MNTQKSRRATAALTSLCYQAQLRSTTLCFPAQWSTQNQWEPKFLGLNPCTYPAWVCWQSHRHRHWGPRTGSSFLASGTARCPPGSLRCCWFNIESLKSIAIPKNRVCVGLGRLHFSCQCCLMMERLYVWILAVAIYFLLLLLSII